MKTPLLLTLLLALCSGPLLGSRAEGSETEASAGTAAPTVFWSLPFFLSSSTSTSFPMGDPNGTRYFDVVVNASSPDAVEVVLRGQTTVVFPGQSQRFVTNRTLGIRPRRTSFTLRLPGEGKKTVGRVDFLK